MSRRPELLAGELPPAGCGVSTSDQTLPMFGSDVSIRRTLAGVEEEAFTPPATLSKRRA